MKKHFNKFLAVLCMVACAFSLTACGGSDTEAIAYNEESVQSLTEFLIRSMIVPMDAEAVGELKDAYEAEDMAEQLKDSYQLEVDGSAFFTGLDSWISASSELGGLSDITNINVSADDEQITSEASITGTNGKTAVMTFTFTRRGKMTSCSTNVDKSFGQLMENAALNTLLGMGTVFAVLILISLIIAAFGLFPKLEAKMKKKDTQNAPAAPAPAPVVTAVEEDETDDLELVAVISAAVAAYEEASGGSGSGYFVRSIKRRN